MAFDGIVPSRDGLGVLPSITQVIDTFDEVHMAVSRKGYIGEQLSAPLHGGGKLGVLSVRGLSGWNRL